MYIKGVIYLSALGGFVSYLLVLEDLTGLSYDAF